jgi:thioredoxin reductase (NADPH)
VAQNSEKVIIIGSGPAGWTAAIYAARANLQPLVYEGAVTDTNRQQGTLPLGQLALTTEVENWPGTPAGDTRQYLKTALQADRLPYWVQADKPAPSHGFNGPEIMELMRQQAVNFGARIITKDVVNIDLSRQPFTLTAMIPGDDSTLETTHAHTVIIATGARANYIGLESEDRFKNRGVSACAVCDGALPRFRKKPVVVVGGGDSAVEEATYLANFASVVHLVHRRDKLRASQIMAKRAIDHPKLKLEWNQVVEEVLGDDDRGVTGVTLKNVQDGTVRTIECAGMFAAIGHTPNTAFLKGQLKTNDKGYLIWTTPQRTYTSIEGVFAAGDVADDYYRQACTAAASGCMAALDAERYLAAKGAH